MDRVILHVDFDSFFASVMQQDYPELRDKPIGIIAHNGRTAIIAASREAKRMGVTSPTRTYIAQQKCPNIKFVRADFIRYFEISKKFLEIANLFLILGLFDSIRDFRELLSLGIKLRLEP